MGRPGINPRTGDAQIVNIRMPDGDVARLIRLASRRRSSRSAVARQLLAHCLDVIERGGKDPPEPG